MFENIRIVLVKTSHPGNIGSAARAMKTMGLHRLTLVAPKTFPDKTANELAAGADDILEQAHVVETLDDALVDCSLVIGTSSRRRDVPLQYLGSREFAVKAMNEAAKAQVAIVFGQERSGLSNEELIRCHYHVAIPTSEDFHSLNLAAAVQLICYELRLTVGDEKVIEEKSEELATHDDVQYFYEHLQETLKELNFLLTHNEDNVMLKLRRLFNRSRLDKVEVAMLRGILSAVQRK